MEEKLAVCILVAWSVGSVVQSTNTSSHTSFLTCPSDIVQNCRVTDNSCKKVPIPSTNAETDLLCIDNKDLRPHRSFTYYELVQCPFAFYDPLKSIGGVCSIDQGNGTSLVLSSQELKLGFYAFDCVVNQSSSEVISKYVVVANDNNPLRAIRIYINGKLDNRTDLSVDVGDSVDILVLAVGNVSNITTNDERFRCKTDFPCQQGNPMKNRYRSCSLRTPVDASDDGRTLRILVDSVELETIQIVLNERPLGPPNDTETTAIISATNTTVATSTSSLATAANATVTTTVITSTSPAVDVTTTATTVVGPVNTPDVTSIQVTTLLDVVSPTIADSATSSSSAGHTTIDQSAMPTGPATDKAPHGRGSISMGASIASITGSLSGLVLIIIVVVGIFYFKCKRTKMRSRSVEPTVVDPGKKVLSYSCQHCNQFDQEIKAKGYVIQKVSQNQSTGKDKDKRKISLDDNIPVIWCGYPECQAQHCWPEGLPVPENVLQLQDDTDGDNHLQSNQKVKLISASQAPINEVLRWLDNVSYKGIDARSCSSSTSYSRRDSLSRKDSINSANINFQILIDKADQMLENQDQMKTGLQALHTDNTRQAFDK